MPNVTIKSSGVLLIRTGMRTPLSSSIIGSSEEAGAVTSQLLTEVGNALGGFSPVVIVLIIVVFIVGFIFFALIAGALLLFCAFFQFFYCTPFFL